jgi:hypothetical protein
MYVAFSWWFAHRVAPEAGPQFMYFFLDTTLPTKVVVLHYILLILTLLVVHCWIGALCLFIESAEEAGNETLAAGTLFTLVAVLSKFQDYGWGFFGKSEVHVNMLCSGSHFIGTRVEKFFESQQQHYEGTIVDYFPPSAPPSPSNNSDTGETHAPSKEIWRVKYEDGDEEVRKVVRCVQVSGVK